MHLARYQGFNTLNSLDYPRLIESITYKLFTEEDLSQLVRLMEKIKPEIAGLSTTSLYSALCYDALLNENVVIIVAHDHRQLVEFNITVIDRKRYWRSFILRHPAIRFRTVHYRLIKALKAKNRDQLNL